MGKLLEFNTSCASVFTQRAALAALQPTAKRSRPAWWRI
jgi:aspartate/methionine/tyrosine aminotransferase